MTHKQMTFNLLKRIQNNPDKYQKGCAAIELRKLGSNSKLNGYGRQYRYYCQEYRSGQCDSRHYCIKKLNCFPPWFYPRDKSAVLLHIFCHLHRINGDRSVEICEQDDQYAGNKVIPETVH